MAVKPVGARRGPARQLDEATATGGTPETQSSSLAEPDAIYDAGHLTCGDGPLLQIAALLRSMPSGAVLEIRSADPGVVADLPAWCRMVGHTYLGSGQGDDAGRHHVRRRED